jgi:hypothetical protein
MVIEFFIIIFYFSPADIYKVVEEERVLLVELMGEDGGGQIVNKSEIFMKEYIIDSGAVDMSYALLAPQNNYEEDTFMHTVKIKIEVFWASLYQTIQRALIIVFWFKYLLILFIPAVISGLVKRKISTYESGWTSPVRYHASLHGLVGLFFIPGLYLSIPITVSPLIVAVWLIASCYVLSVFVSNIQKRL